MVHFSVGRSTSVAYVARENAWRNVAACSVIVFKEIPCRRLRTAAWAACGWTLLFMRGVWCGDSLLMPIDELYEQDVDTPTLRMLAKWC